jgi:hypothetical protein
MRKRKAATANYTMAEIKVVDVKKKRAEVTPRMMLARA